MVLYCQFDLGGDIIDKNFESIVIDKLGEIMNILSEHSRDIKEIKQTLRIHSEKFEEIDETLKLHSKKFEEIDETLKLHSSQHQENHDNLLFLMNYIANVDEDLNSKIKKIT